MSPQIFFAMGVLFEIGKAIMLKFKVKRPLNFSVCSEFVGCRLSGVSRPMLYTECIESWSATMRSKLHHLSMLTVCPYLISLPRT